MPQYHRKKTRASNAFTDLIRAVLRMSAAADREGSKLTRGLDLTSSRWQTLGVLHWAEERLSVSEVARRLGLTRQAVQELVNEMERDGLVTLESDPEDARAKHVVPTPLGEQRHAAALEREWRWTNAIVAGVDVARIEAARETIVLLTEKMTTVDD